MNTNTNKSIWPWAVSAVVAVCLLALGLALFHKTDTRLRSKVKYTSKQASVQDIVQSLAEQVGLKYDWQKSFDQTEPLCQRWVFNVAIEGKTCDEALEQVLKPVGLRYQVEKGVLVLSRQAKAIKITPNDAGSYHRRGDAKQDKNDFEGAIADYTKALELAPDDEGAYHRRGDAEQGKNDWDGAIADYTKAIELKPDDEGAYHRRGDAEQGKNDWDGAIADYTKAIELKPDDAGAYFNRSLAKKAKGDLEGASADHSKAIELQPDLESH
jgi:tetratricopeptide (TPR) repeat protein